MRIKTDILVEKYKNALYAAAFSACGHPQDAEDAVQESFIRYHSMKKEFESEAHIRAWLLRVAINQARSLRRALHRRAALPLEDYADTLSFPSPEDRGLFETVMGLPEKYRVVLHLYYYEDYSVREIAALLSVREGSVKTRLSRARAMLKEILKEDWADDDKF